MKLYSVHCGFYDNETGDGIYESHINLFVAAVSFDEAKQKVKSLDIFKNQTRGVGLWSGADVKTVQCESSGKRCLVDVDVSVAMRMRGLVEPVVTTDVVKETWVKEGWFSDWRYIKD